ncbi:MAG: nucleotide exchange factor GrpE [Desulfovibrionaceae bacterium]|nr:nucleotide exchange factor GrpE [Desulfovibrionaceae bacterium]
MEEDAPAEAAEDMPEKENPISEPEDLNGAQAQEQCEDEQGESSPELDAAALQAILSEERLRMLAEMDNFKKRMLREKEEQVRFAAEAVLADLLPSLDNFELALSYGKGNEACREMLQGLEMTQKLLLDALAAHGLERVGKEGEVFNPEIHEALTRQSRDDMPPGHVAQLFQTGYRLKDRLLRPAKVVVSS